MKIPFNKPSLAGNELRYIVDAVQRKHQLSGDGYYTHQCSRWLERHLGARKVLLTPSCTQALEMAAILLEIKHGDEVIVPSFAFPSTANAFVLRGAKPVFIDIREDTLNLDEQLVRAAITSRTRAIVPIHYAGVPCRMDAILRLARQHAVDVVEDAAQALGASFRGRPAGTLGALNAFSFHETKNYHCGEGGALVIQEKQYVARAEMIRQKGTDRERFLRREIDKYTWVDIGSSYVPSELQAAYLYAQFEAFQAIRRHRAVLFRTYRERLGRYETQGRLRLPVIPDDCESNYNSFYVQFTSERERNRLLHALARVGITAVFHYVPLHLSRMGRRFGGRPGMCPVAEQVSVRLLRLPLYNTMTSREQLAVIRALERAL